MKIFIPFILIITLFVSEANAATISVIPLKNSVRVGEQIIVDVVVNTPDTAVNAVSGTLLYKTSQLSPISISTAGKVNFWTKQPSFKGGEIEFEGIMMNPGYQGSRGTIFRAVFEARAEGRVSFKVISGAVLANDGLGTNVLTGFQEGSVNVLEAIPDSVIGVPVDEPKVGPGLAPEKDPVLPAIIEYSAAISSKNNLTIKGIGEPKATTKLTFSEVVQKSLGERFIQLLQPKKHLLNDVYIQNDESGIFTYTSPSNLIGGAYLAIPFLVDESRNIEKPGQGTELLVKESPIVNALVVLINVLLLLVPAVALIMMIYFIPWYSIRRMHLLKKQLGYEESKIVHNEKVNDKSEMQL